MLKTILDIFFKDKLTSGGFIMTEESKTKKPSQVFEATPKGWHCRDCNLYFDGTFELMTHWESEKHQSGKS